LILELDAKGYLLDYRLWNRKIAVFLALDEGIKELSAEQWKIIDLLRDYYLKNRRVPLLKELIQVCELSLSDIYNLFPQGPAQSAYKIAGLPRPTKCE